MYYGYIHAECVWRVYYPVRTIYLCVLKMLLCSITQDGAAAAGFSTHLEYGRLSCSIPMFSTAVA